jgi:mannose-6-phosphate isomerase-like protein (cupin superfamily)
MKKSLTQILTGLKYLPDRTPEMALMGGAEEAFAEVAPIRDGAIYVGHYSGSSEWERHRAGDELVLALAGSTTLVLLAEGSEQRVMLNESELTVVPAGVWHRFENSTNLKVLTVTPQPTDHRIEHPDANPSLNRSANGLPPAPGRRPTVNHRLPGAGGKPSAPG